MSSRERQLLSPRRAPGSLALLILGVLPLTAATGGRHTTVDEHLREYGWAIDSIRVVEGSQPGIQRLLASGRVLLPAADVWTALEDHKGRENWPSIRESVLEEARGDTTIRRYKLNVPLYKDRNYKLRNIHDPSRMNLRFSMVPGYGNVRAIEGSWRLTALSDSLTGIEYRVATDPGVRLIPKFIVRWATKRAIPRTFAHLHAVADRIRQHSMKLDPPIR